MFFIFFTISFRREKGNAQSVMRTKFVLIFHSMLLQITMILYNFRLSDQKFVPSFAQIFSYPVPSPLSTLQNQFLFIIFS